MPKITKRAVDSLRPDPAGREIFVWDEGDGALKGFGIRMMPSGSASYLIQYRNAHGQTRRMALAKIGVLTPDEARDLARTKLAEVAKGGDPSSEKQETRKGISVADLCDWYMKQAPKTPGPRGRVKKQSTLDLDSIRIESHIKPLIGSKPVIGLTSRDVEKLQSDIAEGKTARPRREKGRGGAPKGGKTQAARTVGMFAAILEFARRQQVIAENPARGIHKFPDEKRRRFLSPAELKWVGSAMRVAEQEGENATGLAALRALLLTGCRRNEILSLPHIWLDPGKQCIRFEDTKSGPQLRPVGATAVDHLTSLPKKKGCPWMFPADRGDGHFIGLPRVLYRISKKAREMAVAGGEGNLAFDNITIHDLRHTFAATAAELGYSELTIAGLLGHTVPGVTARYAHVPDSALVAAADKVAGHIATLLKAS